MQWFEFPAAADCAAALAATVAQRLEHALARDGRAVLAVSGGKSPVPFFHALRSQPLDWSRVVITLVDERFVPADHPDSNAALVREHLLQDAAAAARFLPLVGDARDATAELAAANAAYQQPTVAVLGMGEDGHTASLFPAAAALADGLDPSRSLPLLTVQPLTAPHLRVSMSKAALLACDSLILAIQGAGKRQVFDQAMQGVNDSLPISHFLLQTECPIDVYWTA
ncbi:MULTISPECIES: 6-phosphogluconolactonase [Aquitalea]|uniref:6-phosphogluconolactonase n=3 Tax=Aquitalea magnusonii TaxID=332411 RepID=A0A318K762_9NEIS|nr:MULTISPECIES: 6-phosphogluconolactonase [Aquitalea]PXX50035.1 6-phosphogluconolactonase [Aquitalea magnusonii]